MRPFRDPHAARRVGREKDNLARLDPQCPAPVSDLGGGCAGNTLRVEQRAWLGGTWRARGTALPDPAIVPSAYGFSQTSLPLSNVLSQALAGCDLLVTPDHIALGIASGGEIVTTLAIPDTAALVGVTFYQQLVSFELDANANLVEVTASNALEVTIGSL